MSETTATVEAPAPVETPAPEQQSTTTTAPKATAADDQASLEAFQDQYLAQLDAPDGTADAEPAPQPKQAPPAKPDFDGLPKSQVDALKKFHVTPSAWSKLDQAEREAMLQSFENHISYTSRIGQELSGFKKQPQQQPPATQAQQPAPLGDHWKPIADEYGADLPSMLRQAIQADMAPMFEQFRTLLADMGTRMYDDDLSRTFEELELPEGIDRADEEVRNAILEAAQSHLDHSPGFFSQRRVNAAIKKAAEALYQHQKDAVRKPVQVRPHARGTPTRSNATTPTTRPQLTDEQIKDLAFQGVEKGLSGAALNAFIASGGRSAGR